MTISPRTCRTRSLAAAAACALVLIACTDGDEAPAADDGAAAPEVAAPDSEPTDETTDEATDDVDDPAEADGSSPSGTEVDLLDADGFVFAPTDVKVAVGETVTWVHEGRITHTVTAEDDTFGSGAMAAGDTFAVTFDEPGSYGYVCDFHGTMRGTITVG